MSDNLQRILVIGSGPVVIGRGMEFDYAAVQTCRALHESGLTVIFASSNPASPACEPVYADVLYVEPLTLDVLKRIIETEKPDALLPTVGGDSGLVLALELLNSGFLAEHRVNMLSATAELLQDLQGRNAFLAKMEQIGLPVAGVHRFAEEPNAETDISGWKQLEYQVLRDCAGNCICVSSMENIDPVGIHAGDSMIVIPAQTWKEQESRLLRAAALHIVQQLGIVGNCGIQFALQPDGEEYAVLEVEPFASRSAALVSKATGYPIFFVAAKLALGYKLYEIPNPITGCTTAASEPVMDYCCVKIPKWSFGRFDEANRNLGLSMQATGETLAFGTSFELAFMKAIRSIHNAVYGAALPKYRGFTDEELLDCIAQSNDERIFALYEAISRGMEPKTLYALTHIDYWFLSKLQNLAKVEQSLRVGLTQENYLAAKRFGFLDETVARLSGAEIAVPAQPKFNMVDTCAAEFDAQNPYFYSAWDDENELLPFQHNVHRNKKKILVVGSGPAEIGQSGETEYCNMRFLDTARACGYTTVCLNNNPQAITTDAMHSDRLFFDPNSEEDLHALIQAERPYGIVLQFTGERALSLLRSVEKLPVRVLGATSRALERIATKDARKLFLRDIGVPFAAQYPFTATGLEADVICDGKTVLVPGFSEHIEKSGVIHAADSISVYPTLSIPEMVLKQAAAYAKTIALGLQIQGVLNIQYVLFEQKLYVTDISASAMHNMPFMTRALRQPLMELVSRCMLGETLADLGYCDMILPRAKQYSVRVPVFSFEKLSGADTKLDETMKSTGEVMGTAARFEDALLKAMLAGGMQMKQGGTVLFSVRNSDKQEALAVAENFRKLGFKLLATAGTANLFNSNCIPTSSVRKLTEEGTNILDAIESGKCVYIVSTSEGHKVALEADRQIRRRALEKQIPVFTNLDTAQIFLRCLAQKRSMEEIELTRIEK